MRFHGYIDDAKVGDYILYDGEEWCVVRCPHNLADFIWMADSLTEQKTISIYEGESLEFISPTIPTAEQVFKVGDLVDFGNGHGFSDKVVSIKDWENKPYRKGYIKFIHEVGDFQLIRRMAIHKSVPSKIKVMQWNQ